MGLSDSLDGYELVVVCGFCLLSSVMSFLVFYILEHPVLCAFSTRFRHLRVLGGTVRGQPPNLYSFLRIAAQSVTFQRLAAAVMQQLTWDRLRCASVTRKRTVSSANYASLRELEIFSNHGPRNLGTTRIGEMDLMVAIFLVFVPFIEVTRAYFVTVPFLNSHIR